MNYLAHLFLSGNKPEIIYGNLLEDFMHGRIDHPRNSHHSAEVKKGIRLHRFIDSFTDTHTLVKEAKGCFTDDLGRYASVAIDVVFDHYLIRNWDVFTQEDFRRFRQRIYKDLTLFEAQMPPKLLALVTSMKLHDWLKGYAYDEGLHRAFSSLNMQIKNGPDMTLAIENMHQNDEKLNQLFLEFFEELNKECRNLIS